MESPLNDWENVAHSLTDLVHEVTSVCTIAPQLTLMDTHLEVVRLLVGTMVPVRTVAVRGNEAAVAKWTRDPGLADISVRKCHDRNERNLSEDPGTGLGGVCYGSQLD